MADSTAAYSSFSGIDIIAVIGSKVIATLQGISYSITREKAPIYTFGSANPRSFSRGKRGLAGSMIFTLFDRSALYEIMSTNANSADNYQYYAKEGESYSLSQYDDPWAWSDTIGSADNGLTTKKRNAEYMDQIMPFNITLIAQNEYGLAAWKAILGVEILNEGGGLSVDDITNEEQTTYVARAATAWVPWGSTDGATVGGLGTETDPGSTTVKPASDTLLKSYSSWLGGSAGA